MDPPEVCREFAKFLNEFKIDNQSDDYLASHNLSHNLPLVYYSKLDSTEQNMILNITRDFPLDYARVIFGFIMPVFLIITFITNTLVVIVLAQPHMRNPTNTVLFAMAIVDICTLISPSPWYFYTYTLGYSENFLYPPTLCYSHQLMTDVIPIYFHTASIWLALLLASQRYIYVCHPALAKTWCTVARVKKAIYCILIVALLHQSGRFFDLHYNKIALLTNGKCQPACQVSYADWVLKINMSYYHVTYYTFRIVFVCVIPSVSLITLNCLLFGALRRAENKRLELLRAKFKPAMLAAQQRELRSKAPLACQSTSSTSFDLEKRKYLSANRKLRACCCWMKANSSSILNPNSIKHKTQDTASVITNVQQQHKQHHHTKAIASEDETSFSANNSRLINSTNLQSSQQLYFDNSNNNNDETSNSTVECRCLSAVALSETSGMSAATASRNKIKDTANAQTCSQHQHQQQTVTTTIPKAGPSTSNTTPTPTNAPSAASMHFTCFDCIRRNNAGTRRASLAIPTNTTTTTATTTSPPELTLAETPRAPPCVCHLCCELVPRDSETCAQCAKLVVSSSSPEVAATSNRLFSSRAIQCVGHCALNPSACASNVPILRSILKRDEYNTNVVSNQQQQQQLQQQQRKTFQQFTTANRIKHSSMLECNRTTLMLIVVVSVFLLVEVPVAVSTVMHVALNTLDVFQFVEYTWWLNYVKLFTNFFIILSYPLNFTIYCSMSRMFRETFRQLFICKRRKSTNKTTKTTNKSQANQTEIVTELASRVSPPLASSVSLSNRIQAEL